MQPPILPGTSITTALPPEMLSRIFSFLEFDEIKACRLVCLCFNDCSSPFLIPTVVFACRIDAITHLLDVLKHPYFHQYVTELLFDASAYDQDLVTDASAYAGARIASVRSPDLVQLEHHASKYDSLRHRVLGYESHSPEDRASPQLSSGQQSNDKEEEGGEGGYESSTGEYDYDPSVWIHHRGFSEYSQRFAEQRKLRRDGVPGSVLAQALSGFPGLRHITFGDYRNLGTYRSDVEDCCRHVDRRDVLEPEWLGKSDDVEWEEGPGWEDLFELLHLIVKTGADIRTFSIGGHPYLTGLDADPFCRDAHLPLDHGEGIWCENPDVEAFFRNVRHLRLPVKFSPEESFFYSKEDFDTLMSRNLARPILEAAASMLTRLELHCQDTVPEIVELDVYPDRTKHCLRDILFGIHFKALKHLDLRYWSFEIRAMAEFLEEHASTLRELRMISNTIFGDMRDFATWGGSNLYLEGVEMLNYDSNESDEESRGELKRGFEELWLSGRQNCLPPTSIKSWDRDAYSSEPDH